MWFVEIYKWNFIYPDEGVEKGVLNDKQSDLVYSLIIQYIDKRQYIHVWHTESTKDVWDGLSQQYNKV